MEGKLPGHDDLILVLNSGSSSLKFGVYYRGTDDGSTIASAVTNTFSVSGTRWST